MQYTDREYCPFCTGEILSAAYLCKHCGRDLHTMRIAYCRTKASSKEKSYEVVPDGMRFGIAFQGKVILHGMEPEEAQITAQILNSVIEAERTVSNP
jgi:hypothetical protein